MSKLWLWLHPDIIKQLMIIRSIASGRPVDSPGYHDGLVERIDAHLKAFRSLFGWGDENNPAEFQFYANKYANVLRYYPHALHHLVERDEQMSELNEWVGRLPTGWAEQQANFDSCAAMRSTSEFRRRSNVATLVAVELWGERGRAAVAMARIGGNIVDESEQLRLDEAIDRVFRRYVPLRQAWSWTLLRRLRLLTVAADESADVAMPAVVAWHPTSTRHMLPISSVRLQRLARYVRLHELERRLLRKRSCQIPTECDVAAYARWLDDVEAESEWTLTRLQLHPDIVSVLVRLQNVGPEPTPTMRYL